MAKRERVKPVILAGGSGTRLWPLSRSLYPKQFLALTGEASLFQATLERLDALAAAGLDCAPPLVICNDEHRFLVAELLRGVEAMDATILLEPVGRNTAPAIALAALEAMAAGDEDPLLLVLPADHAVRDHAAFAGAVAAGIEQTGDGGLVTFGVVPTAPETGYGYIRAAGRGAGAVERFVEKPDRPTAEGYLADGRYYWNSGMFLFRAGAVLAALDEHAPAIPAAARAAHAGRGSDLDFVRIDSAAFAESPANSLDYAVLEKTDRARVVPLDAGWSDIGSWSAVWEQARDAGALDADGNAVRGDVELRDVADSLVYADHRLVGALGVSNLVIVETADAVLVAPRDRAQEVRGLVAHLQAEGRAEADLHQRVYRPWGSYEGLDLGDRFQVKRIVVKPGAQLSLQMHHHRAEHWVVVRGTARVTHDGEEFLLTENQSSYIPIGMVHRLENPGSIELELIEVQTGSYLGEDDIVRLGDQYGRG